MRFVTVICNLLIIPFLIITMLSGLSLAADDNAITLMVDGRQVHVEVAPIIVKGRVLLPARFLSEITGVSIHWEQSSRQVSIGSTTSPIAVFQIDTPLARSRDGLVLMDVPPQIVNGRTLIPLRILADTLRLPIHWDNRSRTIYISTSPVPTSNKVPILDARLVPIGTPATSLEALWGRPLYRGRDLAGLEWWTYKPGPDQLIRVAIDREQIAGIYVTGSNWSYGEWNIEHSPSQVIRNLKITDDINISWRGGLFNFTCRASERIGQLPPLFNNDKVAIFFTDVPENRLAGVQVLDLTTFMNSDPVGRSGCDIRYTARVPLPPTPLLNAATRQAAELQEARILLELVNLERYVRNRSLLGWQENLARVARSHSRDMATNNFFSHDSPSTGRPLDRMLAAGINPCGVSENIASGYIDAHAVHHAWMNSAGHRRNILEPQVKFFGAGIYDRYFTQNFTVCLRPTG